VIFSAQRLLWRTAGASLVALVLLCLAWELWLAPLRPGGSWLALKTLPLLWIMPGILRGKIYTFRASTLLILAYFIEGIVRTYTEPAPGGRLALAEIALSSVFFATAIGYVRALRNTGSATTVKAG